MPFKMVAAEDLGSNECVCYHKGTLAMAVTREISNGLKEEVDL